ncbi:SoxR reducing system RseC family protein [Aliikangiella sp. G2MR2-5]|uniref:SoxR reducing system RseC family protein n=1 Tax=Aliikangiella sp. G2MR2-5 TaxID=2788943 RepID=UPI0018A9D5FA|nr:SoxR reducing system RseC family protein [Aliikangiella sp. G2MR2-5]
MSMLTEKGLVTHIEAGEAWVNTRAKLACASCKVESTCGNGILEKYIGDKIFVSKVANHLGARVGDEVTIALPKAAVTRASLVVYILPLFSMLAFALVAQLSNWSENFIILTGLLGFASGLFLVRLYHLKVKSSDEFEPKMISKAETDFDKRQFDSIRIKQID